MNKMDRPYVSGSLPGSSLPLGRYLPLLPSGMVSAWLENSHLSPSDLLLDPFGTTPALALEAARCGRRVLMVCNNPILSFTLETLASAPRPAEFHAALTELGDTRRGPERLEIHLQSLYATYCPNCMQLIQAQGFLWRRGEPQPFARQVDCPHCGLEGEHPVTEADLEKLARLGTSSLHRARAMERIALGPETDRTGVEEALNFYLPRSLYVLFTLINRIEGLPASPERKRLLTAMVISLLDAGSSLWPWPSGRSRPRQLAFPAEFKETNLWLALEKSIPEWCQPGPPVPVTRWPNLPPETGGVCLFSGRLRSIFPLPAHGVHLQTAISVLPRPNAAFWTLSALWTGWLWGREASSALKSAFERRRYDWNWHAAALHSTFSTLNQNIPPGFQVFGLLPEMAAGFLAAALTASQSAGFVLESLSLRSESEPGQIWWKTGRPTAVHPPAAPETLIRQGIQDFLQECGEPQSYLSIFAAGLVCFSRSGFAISNRAAGQELNTIQTLMARIFADRTFLNHSGGSQNGESGLWWLVHPEETEAPVSERLEQKLVEMLQRRGPLTFQNLEAEMGLSFPGLLSPPPGLLQITLEACAEPVPAQPDFWRLRAGETDAEQVRLLQHVEETLRDTALRLGFQPAGSQPLSWQNPRGPQSYCFYLTARAELSPILLSPPAVTPHQCILVYPGSRAALVALRLQRDPRLAAAARSGWRFLKIERIFPFAKKPRPTLSDWETLLKDEPSDSHPPTQLKMF